MRTGLIFLLCAFGVVSSSCMAQETNEDLYYNRLFYLCKIWGHVKYYHPEVASGNVDIDEVLLAALPDVAVSESDEAFNTIVRSMLEDLGEVSEPSSSPIQTFDSLNNNSDLTWINDAILAADVQQTLHDIKDFYRSRPSAYLDRAFSDGNPTFDNDAKYSQGEDFPELNLRLLALFRYWNIIHYFFPYKDIMDNEWDGVLREFIPDFVGYSSALDYHLGFRRMTRNIDDSHAFFLSNVFFNWAGTAYPPFRVRQIEDQMVITQVLENNRGLKPGDIITSVGGQTVESLHEVYRPYAHGSNSAFIDKELNTLILSGPAGGVQLVVEDEQGSRIVTVERNNTNSQELGALLNGPAWRIKDIDDICTYAIIDMRILEPEDIPLLFKEVENVDAIVFDIRNYPQGTLWTLVNYLFEGPIHIASFTVPDIEYPGRLYWKNEIIGQGTSSPYRGKVGIVFDERTLSQAEYTVMGLEQFESSVKVGSITAAADGNVSYVSLPGNIRTVFTGLGTFYPDYSPTQRVGIQPDVEVKPTIQGIRDGKDEVMLRALQELLPCELPLHVEAPQVRFNIFPNPANSLLNYEFDGSHLVAFRILDQKGTTIIAGENPGRSGTIDINNLTNGVYFLVFDMPSGAESHRFVKE